MIRSFDNISLCLSLACKNPHLHLSTLGFWYIQRYWKIETKKMVGRCCVFSLVNYCYSLHCRLLVCCNECRDGVNTVLGDDWTLDEAIWVSEEFIEGPLDLANTRCTLLLLLGSIMHGSSGIASNFKLLLQRIRLLNTDQRAYNIVFGLFQAPYYAFSQTMMAELSPPGFDNMVCIESRNKFSC